MFASEISWGDVGVGSPSGGGIAPAGVGVVLGSVAGAGCSKGGGRGAAGLEEMLRSRVGVPLVAATEVPELVLFWRSRNVSRGGGCFSLAVEEIREQAIGTSAWCLEEGKGKAG